MSTTSDLPYTLYINQELKALRFAFSPAIIIEDLYLQKFFTGSQKLQPAPENVCISLSLVTIITSYFTLTVCVFVLVTPPLLTEVFTLTLLLEIGFAVTFTLTVFLTFKTLPFSVGNFILKQRCVLAIIYLSYQDSEYQLRIR